MSKKESKTGKAQTPSDMGVMAGPPKAPKEVMEMVGKLLTALESFVPKDDSDKTIVGLHENKALASFTVAAFHISHMPDDEYRRIILQRSVPLLMALVRDNEKLRRGAGPKISLPPGSTRH